MFPQRNAASSKLDEIATGMYRFQSVRAFVLYIYIYIIIIIKRMHTHGQPLTHTHTHTHTQKQPVKGHKTQKQVNPAK